jgi:hypothetical protein
MKGHKMKTVIAFLGSLFLLMWPLNAQEADSLLIMDFEDEAAGLGGWGIKFTADTQELNWLEDPMDASNHVLECLLDAGYGTSGGFKNESLNIVVDGDTASGLVIYAWFPQYYLDISGGVQIFAMDKVVWNWQSTWYDASVLTGEAWNRLFFDFDYRFETIEDYNISNGFHAGIEFFYNSGDWWGSIYADDIYLLGIHGEATAVQHKSKSQPASLILEQNYPNPFNPETHIIYSLSQRDIVTVSVYDIKGNLVSTLVEKEIQPAGRIVLRFNASNLPSGVYFYKIQTSNAMKTAKMILVR